MRNSKFKDILNPDLNIEHFTKYPFIFSVIACKNFNQRIQNNFDVPLMIYSFGIRFYVIQVIKDKQFFP